MPRVCRALAEEVGCEPTNGLHRCWSPRPVPLTARRFWQWLDENVGRHVSPFQHGPQFFFHSAGCWASPCAGKSQEARDDFNGGVSVVHFLQAVQLQHGPRTRQLRSSRWSSSQQGFLRRSALAASQPCSSTPRLLHQSRERRGDTLRQQMTSGLSAARLVGIVRVTCLQREGPTPRWKGRCAGRRTQLRCAPWPSDPNHVHGTG